MTNEAEAPKTKRRRAPDAGATRMVFEHSSTPANGQYRTVTFGSATVTAPKRSVAAARADRKADSTSQMLSRLAERLATPGIQIRAVKDVPLFQADPEYPSRLIRVLNGKRERGIIVDGKFKVLK